MAPHDLGDTRRQSAHAPWLSALLVALLLLAAILPLIGSADAAQTGRANIRFEAEVPGEVVALATSDDGAHVIAGDATGTFTFIPGAGADSRAWTAPDGGIAGTIDPVTVGVATDSTGDHWAAAVAYGSDTEGSVHGFARWSDAPIWTFTLPDAGPLMEADQPTVFTRGGDLYAVGTAHGTVYLLAPGDDSGADKSYKRKYDADNQGKAFGRINALALSDDGSRVLIGTDGAGESSLHLFSDTFYILSFDRIKAPVVDTALSPDGAYAAVVTRSDQGHRLHLLDATRGKTIWDTALPAEAVDLALGANADVLAVALADGKVQVYHGDQDGFRPDAAYTHTLGTAARDLAMSASGDEIAVVGGGDDLIFLDPHQDAPLWTYRSGAALTALSMSHEGEVLVIGGASQGSDDGGRVVYTTADHRISHATPPEPRLEPGKTNTVEVLVANEGNRKETLVPRWTGLPTGWDAARAAVTVLPGQEVRLGLEVKVPSGQSADRYRLDVRLESAGLSVPVSLDVRVPEIKTGHTEVPWSLPLAVPGGAPAAYLIEVENTGNVPNSLTLGYAKLPAGWEAAYVGEIDTHLRPGESREVVLKVRAPADATPGRDTAFHAIMAWGHGEERVPLTTKVVTREAYLGALEEHSAADGNGTATPDLLSKTLEESLKGDTTGTAPLGGTEKDTPAPGIGLLIVGVLAAVAHVRRRRD